MDDTVELGRAITSGDAKELDRVIRKLSLGPRDLGKLLVTVVNNTRSKCIQECVQTLLNHGADVEGKGYHCLEGKTPLISATIKGHVAIVQLLVDNGADLEAATKDGNTALLHACQCASHQIVRLLLRSGADPRHTNVLDKTSLMLASSRGDADIVRLLLDTGLVNVNAYSNFKMSTALLEAHRSKEVTELLLQHGADVNQTNRFQESALNVAATDKLGCVQVVKCLLRHGAFVDNDKTTGDDPVGGATPLISAVRNGRMDIAEALLSAGADINKASQYSPCGETPLMQACKQSPANLPLIRFLLDSKDTRVDVGDINNNTALHHSCYAPSPNIKVTKLLLEYGAAVNAVTTFGVTPILAAVVNSNVQAVRTLLEHGADPNCQNCFGSVPLASAVFATEADKLVEILFEFGAKVNNEIHDAVSLKKCQVARKMVEYGATPRLAHVRRLDSLDVDFPVSPFFVALCGGCTELYEYFDQITFLTKFDLFALHRVIQLHEHLSRKNDSKTLNYLKLRKSTVPSLWTLSFVASSTVLGFGSQRKLNLSRSGLPGPLRRKLLFQSDHEGGVHTDPDLLAAMSSLDLDDTPVVSTGVAETNDLVLNLDNRLSTLNLHG